MGWNQVDIATQHPVFNGIENMSYFYFVHSYYANPSDEHISIGHTDYGIRFCSVIAKDELIATQFHPEKVIYEWLVPEIVHSKVARSISKRLSAFFVNECRKNKNILYSQSLLIYNYTLFSRPEILKALRPKKYMLKKNKSSFETSYYFNIIARGI